MMKECTRYMEDSTNYKEWYNYNFRMKKSCKQLGCDFDIGTAYGLHGIEAYIFNCKECGRREILNVKEGEYDERKYAKLAERMLIQPFNEEKWARLQEHETIKRLRREDD